MKILLISGIYFPDIGGPATYIPTLAKGLVDRGFNVVTISLSDEIDVARPTEPWRRIFITRNQNKISRSLKLIRIIRSEARDSSVVFSNGLFLESALALWGLKCKTTAKIVGDPVWERAKNHEGTTYSIDEFATKFNGLKSYIQRKAFNVALKQFDNLTVPGEGLARIVKDWGVAKEIQIIPNGVKCIENQQVPSEFDVISLARLVSWKRIDLLIEACAAAELSLAVVGDGPERENLETLAKSKGCNAKFFGHLDRKDSTHLLQCSSIFALLSTYEGLSFALVEAMMAEKKILVSNIAGNTSVIKDRVEGIVAKSYAPEEIANLLLTLFEDTTDIRKMGIRARKKAIIQYCEDRQVEKMIKLIAAEA